MLTMFLLFPHMYSPSTFLLFLCCHHHYHKYRQEDIITISSQLSPPSTHPALSIKTWNDVKSPSLLPWLLPSYFCIFSHSYSTQLITLSIVFSILIIIYCGQPAWQCSVIEQHEEERKICTFNLHPFPVCTITKNEKHHQQLKYWRCHNGFYWVARERIRCAPHFLKDWWREWMLRPILLTLQREWSSSDTLMCYKFFIIICQISSFDCVTMFFHFHFQIPFPLFFQHLV